MEYLCENIYTRQIYARCYRQVCLSIAESYIIVSLYEGTVSPPTVYFAVHFNTFILFVTVFVYILIFSVVLTVYLITPQIIQGCATVVIDAVGHNLGAIAGGAIALGVFQVRDCG